jgi:hypothetical protein
MSDDERKSVASKSDDECKAIASMSDNKRKAIASMSVYSCSIDRPRGGRWDGEMDVLLGSSLGAMAVL